MDIMMMMDMEKASQSAAAVVGSLLATHRALLTLSGQLAAEGVSAERDRTFHR